MIGAECAQPRILCDCAIDVSPDRIVRTDRVYQDARRYSDHFCEQCGGEGSYMDTLGVVTTVDVSEDHLSSLLAASGLGTVLPGECDSPTFRRACMRLSVAPVPPEIPVDVWNEYVASMRRLSTLPSPKAFWWW